MSESRNKTTTPPASQQPTVENFLDRELPTPEELREFYNRPEEKAKTEQIFKEALEHVERARQQDLKLMGEQGT